MAFALSKKFGKARIPGRMVLAFVTVGLSLSVSAQNMPMDGSIDGVIRQLGLKKTNVAKGIFTQKALPYAKNIVAMVITTWKTDDEILDVNVVLVEKGKIVSRFYEKNALATEGFNVGYLQIDTAPYILKSGVRAFGVRVPYIGGPRAFEEQISLFITQGNTLKRVLKNYTIYGTYTTSDDNGEWYPCKDKYIANKGVISIAKESTNGFANLVVSRKIINTVEEIVRGDECQRKETTQRGPSETLRFNGHEYK